MMSVWLCGVDRLGVQSNINQPRSCRLTELNGRRQSEDGDSVRWWIRHQGSSLTSASISDGESEGASDCILATLKSAICLE